MGGARRSFGVGPALACLFASVPAWAALEVVQLHSNEDLEGGCGGMEYSECVGRFLDAPPPGVGGLLLSGRKPDAELRPLILRAREQGLFVGSWIDSLTPPEQVRDAERLVRLGFDFIETDELYVRGLASAEDLNRIREAVKGINPEVLVGQTETPTAALARALAEGARPDFILNEVYADTPGELDALAELAGRYGIPAGTWLDDSGAGGHSLGFACEARRRGLSAFYFNAAGYFDRLPDLEGCEPAPRLSEPAPAAAGADAGMLFCADPSDWRCRLADARRSLLEPEDRARADQDIEGRAQLAAIGLADTIPDPEEGGPLLLDKDCLPTVDHRGALPMQERIAVDRAVEACQKERSYGLAGR